MATRSLNTSMSRSASRPTAALPHWPRAPWCGHLRERVQRHLLFPAVAHFCQIEVAGAAVFDHLQGPILIAANHTSHLDTPSLLAALPVELRRRTTVAAAADYWFHNPLLAATVALSLNAFPLQRHGPATASLRACGQLSAAGWSLLLYPEGTRSRDGQLGAFRPGVGRLAVELGVPVVPAYLDGLAAVLPKGQPWPRPGRARVSFGTPLTFGREAGAREATTAIEAAVRSLSRPNLTLSRADHE